MAASVVGMGLIAVGIIILNAYLYAKVGKRTEEEQKKWWFAGGGGFFKALKSWNSLPCVHNHDAPQAKRGSCC
jgi:hypothetical protein